jgi:hypothetical protein
MLAAVELSRLYMSSVKPPAWPTRPNAELISANNDSNNPTVISSWLLKRCGGHTVHLPASTSSHRLDQKEAGLLQAHPCSRCSRETPLPSPCFSPWIPTRTVPPKPLLVRWFKLRAPTRTGLSCVRRRGRPRRRRDTHGRRDAPVPAVPQLAPAVAAIKIIVFELLITWSCGVDGQTVYLIHRNLKKRTTRFMNHDVYGTETENYSLRLGADGASLLSGSRWLRGWIGIGYILPWCEPRT